MMIHALAKRERALSLWIQDRLHERRAVEWATSALKRIRGELGNELVSLFAFLDEHAQRQSGLDERCKIVWKLLHRAARENVGGNGGYVAFELRQELKGTIVQPETADRVIEVVRPRLRAEPLSAWAQKEEGREDQPLRWVDWTFKAQGGSLSSMEATFGRTQLRHLPEGILLRLVERGTDALADAYRVAGEVMWLDRGLDIPNLFVHRIVAPSEPAESDANDDDDEDNKHDPDAYDGHFAPLMRLLSGAFEHLSRVNAEAARGVSGRWDAHQGGLFVRLAAFARWNVRLRSGNEVASYLGKLAEQPFWRWTGYPEIASLRGVRWKDLPTKLRKPIEDRLVKGPSAEAFSDSADFEVARQYHRDHELARIVDAGGQVSKEARRLVEARRQEDKEFPKRVPAFEPGAEGVRVRSVPEGDAGTFEGVSHDELLAALFRSSGRRRSGEGNDAEAFGRTPGGKARIIEALERTGQTGEVVDRAWDLLLSFPPQKSDDPIVVRELSEKIVGLALQQPGTRIAAFTDRLSYWVNQADEIVPRFAGGEELWQVLLPVAAERAEKWEDRRDDGDKKGHADLTGAALNEPLGHLISMFLRRCPAPQDGVRPTQPAGMTQPLKNLRGRARELIGNRLAVLMGYFALADSAWLETVVLVPMASESPEGDRLWEAFTKYGQVPPHEIWMRLEPFAFRRLTSDRLSSDGRRRLTEMAIVIWSWSKEARPLYSINSTALRSTLALADDDVRAQAAWYFQSFFRGSKAKANAPIDRDLWSHLGKAFFSEVWPLEPALQSSKTANHFANIPGHVGEQHFVEAVETILPFLRTFDVWSVWLEFSIGKEEDGGLKVVEAHPERVLQLLAASISPSQRHRVLELEAVLGKIVASAPALQSDARVRALRRLAHE
jgi:hypothetical protein